MTLESTFGEEFLFQIAFYDVDNLILNQGFVISGSAFPTNIILSSGDKSMKDWKALVLKITLLVLVGIVMLTG